MSPRDATWDYWIGDKPPPELPGGGYNPFPPGGGGDGGGDGDGGNKPPDRGAEPRFGELRIDAPDFTLRVRQGMGVPTPELPGGWGTVARPDRVALTEWSGQEPRRESVPIMIDGFAKRRAIERQIARLESLCEVPKGDRHPPVFKVRGGIHLAGRDVVLEGIEFTEAHERRRPDDVRIRQGLVLHLMEYQRPDRIEVKRRGKRVYTVKRRESLRQIAVKLKPKASKKDQVEYAREIGKLNRIRDIRRKLKPGTKLKLP